MAVAADSIASGGIAAPRPLDARLDESMVRGSPGSSGHEAPNDHGRNAQIETLVVFFETGQPHGVAAAQLINEGIEIARAFPPFDRSVRISIGLPAENARARDAIKKLLG